MRERPLCIVDVQEITHGLSFGEMTFDLGPGSKVKNAIFGNNSNVMTDRDHIHIVLIGNHIQTFI